MEYYVYVYLDPRKPGKFEYLNYSFEYEPFYVGKGKGRRYKEHLFESVIKKGNTSPKVGKLKKLNSLGIKPIIQQIKYFVDENDAYQEEINLITVIGSDFISEICDGPLTNMILEGDHPPNHKGKTYLEIYGSKEKAEEQRKIRHDKQLAVGGFFKGGKHSIDSKQSIGIKSKENQKNGGYRLGINHDELTKIKMKSAKLNKMPSAAKGYILCDNSGIYHKIIRLHDFCKNNNLSISTLKKTMKTKVKVAHGKTKGWIIVETFIPSLSEWINAKI